MLDLPTARRVVSVVCADLGVTPVYPDDLAAIYRATLVGAFAAWRSLQSKPYPVGDALRDESFAIPGLPSAAAPLVPLITGVPVVGPVLADVMGAALEDRLYFAPAACKDGVTLVATAARLLSYATTWQRGVGVAFAAAWLAIGEARAGLGAQAAVQGAQVRVALGVSVVEAFADTPPAINDWVHRRAGPVTILSELLSAPISSEAALAPHGVRLRHAATREALEAEVAVDQPDLMLFDYWLEPYTGPQLVRMLRDLPEVAAIPKVCLTGDTGPVPRQAAMDAGFAAVLRKTVDPDDLVEVMRQLVASARRR